MRHVWDPRFTETSYVSAAMLPVQRSVAVLPRTTGVSSSAVAASTLESTGSVEIADTYRGDEMSRANSACVSGPPASSRLSRSFTFGS